MSALLRDGVAHRFSARSIELRNHHASTLSCEQFDARAADARAAAGNDRNLAVESHAVLVGCRSRVGMRVEQSENI